MVEWRFSGSIVSSNPSDGFDGCLQFISEKEGKRKNFRTKRKSPGHILPKSKADIEQLHLNHRRRFLLHDQHSKQRLWNTLSSSAASRCWLGRKPQHSYVHPIHHLLFWTGNPSAHDLCSSQLSLTLCLTWLLTSLVWWACSAKTIKLSKRRGVQPKQTPSQSIGGLLLQRNLLVHHAVPADDDTRLGSQVFALSS